MGCLLAILELLFTGLPEAGTKYTSISEELTAIADTPVGGSTAGGVHVYSSAPISEADALVVPSISSATSGGLEPALLPTGCNAAVVLMWRSQGSTKY